MNSAYIYLQIYRLFDSITPIKADCGALCDKACCKGDDSGMYLFPGEEKVFSLLKPGWITVEDSDFTYSFNGKNKHLKIAFCKGECDRYQRPLSCRIFPLAPYLKDGKLEIIIDPRSKAVCPLGKTLKLSEYDASFVRNVENAFCLLMKNKEFKAFMVEYSKYLDEFLRFFPIDK